MKKIASIILTLAIALSGVTAIAENDEIKVYIDGEQVEFDVPPMIQNDVTLVPMRAIFKAMDADVFWDADTRTAAALKEVSSSARVRVQFVIGDDEMRRQTVDVGKDAAKVTDNQTIELDVPAQIAGDRTLVPLRAISEAFDYDAQWDRDTKTVTITSKQPEPTLAPVSADDTYTSRLMAQAPQNENFVISPFSLKMAMLMTANGAKGETQKEILDAFGVKDIDKYNSEANETIARLNTNDKGEVNIANSIWFNKDIGGKNGDFSDSFKNIISNVYSGNAETVTNKNSVEAVNEWVEEQTNGKIKDLLTDGNREYLTALVNAIYMKADWRDPFEKEATYKDTFTDIDGKKTETDFMRQTSYFQYYEDGDAKIVRMPYTNGLSMYIALGDSKSIENVRRSMLSSDGELSVFKKVNLTIPKFKTEYTASELKENLKALGVNKAFEDGNPDFDDMVQNVPDPIKIDDVLQKAIIEVDEKGTEAAAATASMGGAGALLTAEKIYQFKADRPFTYYIADDKTGEILFAGRYVKCE